MNPNYLALTRAKINVFREATRRFYLKRLGLKIGKGGLLSKIKCEWPGNVSIGHHCTLQEEICFWIKNPFAADNTITIGDRVFIGRKCEFNCNSKITIGNDCLIASNTIFVDIGHGIEKNALMNTQPCSVEEIVIEDDVWIGTQSIILKGVTIGKGSIVGAGSLVNRSIPGNEIWAGSPAKFIRHRV